MRMEPRVLARSAAQALTVAAVAAGGVVVVASPAYAAPPAISTVFVAGSTTNKVVTAGTTVLITGTGFSGMTDNAAATACNVTPAAYPAANSGCSQVRFYGVGTATPAEGYTLATRYTVVSDTQIYATVPTIAVATAAALPLGAAAVGTGSVKVQVVNTMAGGTSSLISASTTSELFYRHALTAAVSGTVTANPIGGGTVAVTVGSVAPMTAPSLVLEKITAYFTSVVAGSPTVVAAPVTFKDADEVNVVLPPGSPAGNFVGIMLVHDGIAGEADVDSLKYPAVITRLESCATNVIGTDAPALTATLPVCTGSATAPGTDGSNIDVKVTGKGLTGATVWNFEGAGGDVTAACTVVSDTVAYCDLDIDEVPDPAVAAVTFTPADPDGAATAPALVPTAGSILIYSSLV